MTGMTKPSQTLLRVDTDSDLGTATTSWGEQGRVRLSARNAALSVMDYRAPAHFGPPRHRHRNDDEIFLVQAGTLVLWTPERCSLAKAGDIVMLPKAVAHAWRAYGEAPVHLQVITTPGEFESFFSDIVAQRLEITDIEALTAVASKAGMDIVGPPLSDEEVDAILRGEHLGAFG